jgi:hypothetical protein
VLHFPSSFVPGPRVRVFARPEDKFLSLIGLMGKDQASGRASTETRVADSDRGGRQARGLRFLRSTATLVYDHKNVMKIPDLKDRLGAASAAKKAQIERARAIAEDPARLKRIAARSEIVAARNIRMAERERLRREAMAREAAERAAVEAAEAAALAARKAEEDAREAKRAEQARLEAAAAAEREEALLAIRRAGRKKKKRKGH